MPPTTRAEVQIRRATSADAHRIAALIEQYVASGTLLPRTPEFVAERAIDYQVATIRGDVIGCAHLEEYSPSLAELRSLAVDPGYQRKGIGTLLVRAIEKLAKSRDYLTVFAVSNDEEYFRQLGYERREIPELDRERSEVSKFKGVYAKDVG